MAYAFPTTSVLDNCQRADENPLSNGGLWTTMANLPSGLELLSKKIEPVSSFGGSYIGLYTNPESWCTWDSVSNQLIMSVRILDSAGNSPIRDDHRQGYQWSMGATTYKLERPDDGSTGVTLIADTAYAGGAIAGGTQFGVRSLVTGHELWIRRPGAALFTQEASATDGKYVRPGVNYFQLFDAGGDRIVTVGGGEFQLVAQVPLHLLGTPRR